MDNTNQILAAFAAVLVAVASVLATLGHRDLPYLIALLSLLLVALMIWRAVRQRRTSKTNKNLLGDSDSALKPDILHLGTSEAITKKVINEQQPDIIKPDEKDLHLELQAAKERAQQLEAEKTMIEQELVNTKYKTTELTPKLHEIERQKYKTTELQHDASEDEATTKRILEVKPKSRYVYGPPNPKTPVNNIPFETGYGQLWTEYTQDVFYGVLWTWKYRPEIDNTPRSLTPHCPECDDSTPMIGYSIRSHFPYESLKCPYHPQQYKINEEHSQSGDPFPKTKKLILQKLEDGSWFDAVNKQKRARGQEEINPSVLGCVDITT